LERQSFGNGEFGHAVNQGPGHARQFQRIARRQTAFGLRGLYKSNQHPESAFGGGGEFRVVIQAQGPVEHYQQMLGRAQRKPDIDHSGGLKAAQRGMRLAICLPRFKKRFFEPFETLCGDGGQQFILVAEVTIGGIVGDACAAGHLAQCKSRGAHFGDQLQRGLQKHRLEIAVMVRLRDGHARRITELC